jgi:hypothetical protein
MRPEVPLWSAWWAKAGADHVFPDRDQLARALRRGGHAVVPGDVYEDVGSAQQDVIVLVSPAEGTERLFQAMRVDHRLLRGSQVGTADLHPFAVVISGQNEYVGEAALGRLRWFVRTGGRLFVSCLPTEIVDPLVPGFLQGLEAADWVNVPMQVEACPEGGPWTAGVFPSFTRPRYGLPGSRPIVVLQPERVVVLIDSPECATRHRGGNLACVFRSGHGLICDTAYLFHLFDLHDVGGLKTGRDRMAYAMDHLGVDYDEARRLAEKRTWDNQAEARKTVFDHSPFRLVTNFVRQMRLERP